MNSTGVNNTFFSTSLNFPIWGIMVKACSMHRLAMAPLSSDLQNFVWLKATKATSVAFVTRRGVTLLASRNAFFISVTKYTASNPQEMKVIPGSVISYNERGSISRL